MHTHTHTHTVAYELLREAVRDGTTKQLFYQCRMSSIMKSCYCVGLHNEMEPCMIMCAGVVVRMLTH